MGGASPGAASASGSRGYSRWASSGMRIAALAASVAITTSPAMAGSQCSGRVCRWRSWLAGVRVSRVPVAMAASTQAGKAGLARQGRAGWARSIQAIRAWAASQARTAAARAWPVVAPAWASSR